MIERTKNWGLIKRIITDKSVYSKASEDKSPKPEDYEPVKDDRVYYLLAKNGMDILGLFVVTPENGVCYKVHTCLLPHSYGEKATVAAKELVEWVFQNLDCKRLITEVPEFNKLALKFALRSGMEKYGFNEKSWLKDGHLYGITLLGITNGGASCQ